METRNKPIHVTEVTNLPETERECFECENGVLRHDGHELVCGNCYVVAGTTSLRSKTEWERHRSRIERRRSGEEDGRPRLVGGYKEAYWGDDEYAFSPEGGFTQPQR